MVQRNVKTTKYVKFIINSIIIFYRRYRNRIIIFGET